MKNDVSTQNWGMAAITILCCESMEEWEGGSQMGVAEIQKISPSTTGRCYQTSEWGQLTNGSAAWGHGSQSQLYSFFLCGRPDPYSFFLVDRIVISNWCSHSSMCERQYSILC